MNRFLSVIAIAVVSLACLSGAAPIDPPKLTADSFRVYCQDVPKMLLAASAIKQWHIEQIMVEPDKALRFVHIAEAKGLEDFMKHIANIKCVES